MHLNTRKILYKTEMKNLNSHLYIPYEVLTQLLQPGFTAYFQKHLVGFSQHL